MDTYINTGVSLFNLKKIRNDRLEETFDSLIGRFSGSTDQHIINVACFGKIKILPFKFNVLTKYNICNPESYDSNLRLSTCFTKDEYDEAVSNPVIIHFADRYKPWTYLTIDFAKNWWDYFFQCIEDKAIFYSHIESVIGSTKKLLDLRNNDLEKKTIEIIDLQAKNEELESRINKIYKSRTFRVGSVITRFPRIIIKLFRGE